MRYVLVMIGSSFIAALVAVLCVVGGTAVAAFALLAVGHYWRFKSIEVLRSDQLLLIGLGIGGIPLLATVFFSWRRRRTARDRRQKTV